MGPSGIEWTRNVVVHSSKIKHKEKEMVQLYEKETGERWRVDVMTGSPKTDSHPKQPGLGLSLQAGPSVTGV